jgi:hypothetical protein
MMNGKNAGIGDFPAPEHYKCLQIFISAQVKASIYNSVGNIDPCCIHISLHGSGLLDGIRPIT